MARRKKSVFTKSVILAMVIYGVVMSTDDANTFTKFTTLSNIGIGIAMLIFVVVEIVGIRSGKDYRKQWMYVFKFMMTIGVIITFAMYATLIGPKNQGGLLAAYGNHHYGSLMMHLAVPVLSVIDFYVFDDSYSPKYVHALYSILPPIAYVAMIYVMAQGGRRWAHGMSAPYAFLNFDASVGWWGFDLSTTSAISMGIGVGYLCIILIAIFVLIGIAMLAIKKKVSR